MIITTIKFTFKYAPALFVLAVLTSCSTVERLADVGKAPELTRIENPQTKEDYRPVSMPMPIVKKEEKGVNSLWSGNRKTFFEDQRANNVGDILTVLIEIDDEAEFKNKTNRTRSSSEGAGLNNLLGLEASLNRVLPQAVNNADLVDMKSDSSLAGNGITKREEVMTLSLAATITQILPNGNMVIQGRQEMRVNFEKRVLELAGIIRPEDIGANNTITHDKIAEARIAYGGKGQITDVQQPRYGQQIYDILFPF